MDVAPFQHPQHVAGDAGEEGGREQGRGGAVLDLRSGAGDLMQGSERHSAARQPGVDGGHPERDDGGGAGPPLQAGQHRP